MKSQPFSEDSQPNDDYRWCAFEARQDKSIIIEYVVLFGQVVIFTLLIYARVKAKRQQQLDQLSVVYKLIVTWLICFFVKTLMNVVSYFAYIQWSPSNEEASGEREEINFTGLRVMSSVFFFMDFLTTFMLQNAMIYIPYLWMRNALQLLPEQNLQVQDRIQINRISYLLGLVKKYLIFRNLYIVYNITIAILIISSDSFKFAAQYVPITSLIESFVILIIYPAGLWAWNLIKDNIPLNQKEQKSMLIQYGILLFCNGIRIVLNSIFYFSNLVHYTPDHYCYDDHSESQTTYVIFYDRINCMYLAIGLLSMHILPGSMILYVYWPSKKDKNGLKASLLISASDTKLY